MKSERLIEMLKNSSYEAVAEIAVFALGIIIRAGRLPDEDIVKASIAQGILTVLRKKGKHHERSTRM